MTKAVPPADAMQLHAEAECKVRGPPSTVFEHIDRPERLSAHMAKRSWRLAGSAMTIETDAAGGRSVGSHIRLAGRMCGIPLYVECRVVQRDPPSVKAWETVGEPRLLVIGQYRVSVNIEPGGNLSRVRIAIVYMLPVNVPARWIGMLFGPMYARWCVRQMARDLVDEFGGPES